MDHVLVNAYKLGGVLLKEWSRTVLGEDVWPHLISTFPAALNDASFAELAQKIMLNLDVPGPTSN
eukprot:9794853-Ditylum_brightwellii.AAC.1